MLRFLETADEIHAYGGGLNTAITLKQAKELGKKIFYTPADMNHNLADAENKMAKTGVDKNYKGEAFGVI